MLSPTVRPCNFLATLVQYKHLRNFRDGRCLPRTRRTVLDQLITARGTGTAEQKEVDDEDGMMNMQTDAGARHLSHDLLISSIIVADDGGDVSAIVNSICPDSGHSLSHLSGRIFSPPTALPSSCFAAYAMLVRSPRN